MGRFDGIQHVGIRFAEGHLSFFPLEYFPFFLEAVVEGPDIREELPEIKDIQRIVRLGPGPPGSNGQGVVFG